MPDARRFAFILAVCALSLPAGGAGAQTALPWELVLDPGESSVRFELGATLHTVRGSFRVREGAVRFDPESGAVAGRVVIDATSGDTGNATRDRNLHEQVLASERHPDIVFVPERIEVAERTEDSLRGALGGRVEIRGGAHPVEIPFEARRVAPGRGRATGRFEVPYVAWGLPDPSVFLLRVEKTVSVRFEAVGALSRLSRP